MVNNRGGIHLGYVTEPFFFITRPRDEGGVYYGNYPFINTDKIAGGGAGCTTLVTPEELTKWSK
jgi:hypothetical protein